MEILVNRERIDFTLEHEKTAGEVVDGLAQWLESGGMAVTALSIDDEALPIHDRSPWADIALDSVTTINVEALPASQVQQTALEALDEYLQLLASCITSGEASALADLVTELPYVRTRIAAFFPDLAVAEKILDNDKINQGQIPSQVDGTLAEIERLRAVIDTRIREYVDPDTELLRTLNGLVASVPALREIPVDLQTGRAGEAMHTVVQFAELFSRVLRLMPRTDGSRVDRDKVRAFAESLAPHLKEVKEAIEAEDSVLLGDLMEYEIAPQLDALGELVTSG